MARRDSKFSRPKPMRPSTKVLREGGNASVGENVAARALLLDPSVPILVLSRMKPIARPTARSRWNLRSTPNVMPLVVNSLPENVPSCLRLPNCAVPAAPVHRTDGAIRRLIDARLRWQSWATAAISTPRVAMASASMPCAAFRSAGADHCPRADCARPLIHRIACHAFRDRSHSGDWGARAGGGAKNRQLRRCGGGASFRD